MKAFEVRLGPAGSSGFGTLEGIKFVKEKGLQAMEVEFVRGVKMRNELARQCGDVARELGIELSIHAPYYINLASEDMKKRKESMQRILDSCERGHHLGATNVVFHAAYYGKYPKEKVHEIVRESVIEMQEQLKRNEWDVKLAPEATGKVSQWGEIDEITRLVKETGCSFCVDFAHVYARNRGVIDYKETLDRLETVKPKHTQCHFSNIEYTLKGERMHLVIDHKPPFEPLAKEILKRKINTTIISESPITWKDSLKMKGIFEKLGYRF
jgi:deoxyribonuclease-4